MIIIESGASTGHALITASQVAPHQSSPSVRSSFAWEGDLLAPSEIQNRTVELQYKVGALDQELRSVKPSGSSTHTSSYRPTVCTASPIPLATATATTLRNERLRTDRLQRLMMGIRDVVSPRDNLSDVEANRQLGQA